MIQDWLALPETQFFLKWWWAEMLIVAGVFLVMWLFTRREWGPEE